MEAKELKEKIEQIDKETYKIYCDVIENKNISVYKNMLLNAKLNILESNLIDTFMSLLNIERHQLQKVIKYEKIIFICCIVAFILLLINPFIGLAAYMLAAIGYIKFVVKETKRISTANEIGKYINQTNQMEILFRNCRTFLNAHTNYELTYCEEELNNKELKKIDLANQYIKISLLNCQNVEVPEEIEGIMIQILQSNLETNEQNLDELIQMAISKENVQSLENNEEVVLKRTKKNKKQLKK